MVPNAKWERRPHFGWCSNWQYSQRNPESPMSVLAEAEFGFIDQFWGEHDKVGSWHLCEWSEPPMAGPKLRVKP